MIKVINVISDTNIGGAGKMLLNFMKLSKKSEFEHLAVIPDNSLLAPEFEKLGIRYTAMAGIGEKSLSLSAVRDFLRLFRRVQPDIVHTHAVLSARIAARLYGKCKVVHTRHSVFDQSRWKKSFPMKQISGLINNGLSDVIIAVSPAAAENMVETGTDPGKIQLIFNGTDSVRVITEEERAATLAAYGLNRSDFVCAIIARLEEVKGHAYVLAAAKILAAYPDIKIMIAGAGQLEETLRQTARDMGLHNCIFTGFVKDIYKIENIMKLQLNASYGTEATSLSLLEGMSLGIPAVVSDFGGNPYVIIDGENGRVIPKKEPALLAKAILELYQNSSLYEKMSVNAAKIFNEKFTSKAMTANIEAVYKELMKGRDRAVNH